MANAAGIPRRPDALAGDVLRGTQTGLEFVIWFEIRPVGQLVKRDMSIGVALIMIGIPFGFHMPQPQNDMAGSMGNAEFMHPYLVFGAGKCLV